MRTASKRLARLSTRKLAPGERITERGITYERLLNGDGLFTVNIMVDGQRIHRTIGRESAGTTRTQAEEYIAKIKTDARAGRLNLPKGRKVGLSLAEAAGLYLNRLVEEGGKDLRMKRQRLRLHILPVLGKIPLPRLSSFDLERYKKSRLDAGAAKSTINREMATLSHLFTKAEDWRWIDRRPVRIKRFREDGARLVYLTPEQARHLVAAAAEDQNPHIHPFIVIALLTAMRKTEILNIRKDHIDLERRIIHIPKGKAGSREQPITADLADYLRQYMQGLPTDNPWLLPVDSSKSGHTTEIAKPFRRVVAAAGLDPKQVIRHTLRHTAISHLVQAGVDLPTVQRISGHKSMAMVMRYSHQNGQHIQAAMDKLEIRMNLAGASSEPETAASITQELHKPKNEGFTKAG
jgi:integrase